MIILNDENVLTNKKFVAIIATLCCLLWGSAFPSIKTGYILFNISTIDIPSKFVFAGYRFSIAGIVLLLIAQKYGKKIFSISAENVKSLFILGILQTSLQYTFFYIGVGRL